MAAAAVSGVSLTPPPPLRLPFETTSTAAAVLALLTRPTRCLSALPARRPAAGDAEEGGVDRPHFHRMPTLPWVTAPLLLLPPEQALDLSNPGRSKKMSPDAGDPDGSLTGKVRGGWGRKAMRLIVRSVSKLHRLRQPDDAAAACPSPSSEDGVSDRSNGGAVGGNSGWLMREVEQEKKLGFPRLKKETATTAAEWSLDPACLTRLRGESTAIRKWVTVKKARGYGLLG